MIRWAIVLLTFFASIGLFLFGGDDGLGAESPKSEAPATASVTPAGAPAAADHAPAPLAANAAAPAATNSKTDANGKRKPANAAAAEPICLADPLAVDDIRRGREELAEANRRLAAREAELASRERAINEELKKLERVREDIARIESIRGKENEEKVAKLVETFETMSPKAAAQVLATVDEALAVAAIERMSTPKLAKIMNIMETSRSSRLSEQLAGVVRARKATNVAAFKPVSNDAAAATMQKQSANGGDNKNGQENNASTDNGNAAGVSGNREPAAQKAAGR